MSFLPTQIQRHPTTAKGSSPEYQFWKRYKHPVFIKNYSPVTSIHFASVEPHKYAVTSAMRVQIFAPRTQKVVKTITRFNDVARSGNIRHDGKLLVAGDDSGLIQVFDITSRAVLRSLKEHKQPVHVTKFSPKETTQLLSCSDDSTVKLWDIPSQSSVTTFTDHTDYVRSGVMSNLNPSLILTGSYDSTVRLFDARTGAAEMVMGSAERGQAPVEDVLLFPSDTLALSSSGPILRVWDLVAGGRCLRALSNHQKTITCMAFNGSASRLLTGGLDQMVKVYDVSSYRVVHTMRYSAPLLCLAMSPDDTHIAAGMSDGTLSVRRRNTSEEEAQAAAARKEVARTGDFESMLEKIGEPEYLSQRASTKPKGDPDEAKLAKEHRKKLTEYDKLLKQFKYGEALDAVLVPGTSAVTFFSLLQELVYREGLRTALGGRDDVLLEPVLQMLTKYIADTRWGPLACEVAGVLLGEEHRFVIWGKF
ncbi:hypothetical protein M407DRAFT_211574 [Tulasnella calospora MUT 4182]|uniref:U3 small nucleolar RNA-associated protein 15 C-terminal domain-containing protein n=1 Tax=Tulasnella calospora MUT 4182 TaxID=1051891 RepID=A0A0C3MGN2_9AGAM|nr:hypothetical protein M407DRAFT_211574 [Tulasnella calospora MUT 4182]